MDEDNNSTTSSQKNGLSSVFSRARHSLEKKLHRFTETLSGGSNHNTGPPPEPDPILFQLIDYKPWDEEDRKHYNDDVVYRHVQQHPRSVQVEYEFRRGNRGHVRAFPLFRIIALGGSLRTIEMVVKAHPPALQARTDFKTTPLHSACSYAASLEIVEYILRKDKDTGGNNAPMIRQTNRHVFLPLHNACQATLPHATTLPVIQRLVELYPEALLKSNKLGETPLQTAQRNPHCRPEVLQYLMEQEQHQQSLQDIQSGHTDATKSSGQFTSSTDNSLGCLGNSKS